MAGGGKPPAIELKGISKSFGPVQANRDVTLRVMPGTIHGIVGENGAGKSTLMSILYGFYQADAGEILVDGKGVIIESSRAAIDLGIGMVHQHFMLVETMSVLDNVMLGSEGGALLDAGEKATRQELARLSSDYGLTVDPDELISDLSVGQQQRVEILKALVRGARILVLDEPTGVLTPQEADRLFEILAALKERGVTIILITHKLREILAATDTVSVMRQGEMVAHRTTSETSADELAELMVGRKVLLRVDKKPAEAKGMVLSADGLTVTDARGVERVKNACFQVRAGEIVGIAGVAGNGQSELLQALAGIRPLSGGSFSVNGTRIVDTGHALDPHEARRLGIAHVPEDRHHMGLVTAFTAHENHILGHHDWPDFNRGLLLDREAAIADCAAEMERYDVRPPNPQLTAAMFSGGNQQKIVLARELETKPKLLLVGQPTRGVDIGAIEFIHNTLVSMRDQGAAVLLVSVELDEIMSLSDRILVMSAGRIVGEMEAAEADPRRIGLMMADIPEEAPWDGKAA
ncbi:ABC transporter ATP-binding protein [Nisaea acidiphila]|uniref:ABC transporter ATP-binding protein n=1 Tax=Nisaea acidiphila TaxID=1862145 RepID=A0A9J7ASG2_9PROT|nr:ABC transporter ATP-binding protein [Nisaea acidiphila]UUX48277.1 ABC transporter ATP-binding protein [Nisaea acidiphila]